MVVMPNPSAWRRRRGNDGELTRPGRRLAEVWRGRASGKAAYPTKVHGLEGVPAGRSAPAAAAGQSGVRAY